MRTTLILAAVVLIAALLGWLTFSSNSDTATMSIDKQQVQEDTESAVEKVKEVAQETKDEIQEAVNGDETTSDPSANLETESPKAAPGTGSP